MGTQTRNGIQSRGFVYGWVALIAAAAGAIGFPIASHFMNAGNGPIVFGRGSLFGAGLSVPTWLVLVHFLNGRSATRAILVGALSPFAGCVVLWIAIFVYGVINGGLLMAEEALPGLLEYWAFAGFFYYLLAPFGIATALAIFLSLNGYLPVNRPSV